MIQARSTLNSSEDPSNRLNAKVERAKLRRLEKSAGQEEARLCLDSAVRGVRAAGRGVKR